MRLWYVFHLLGCSALESIEPVFAQIFVSQNPPIDRIASVHIPESDELLADPLELYPKFGSIRGRYNSFMSFQAWRSSGGISAYGGVIYFPIKTGTEELISRFKYIQLINKGYGGEAPPAIPHHPKQDVKRKVSFVRSLGGKGGPRRRTL